MEFRKLAIIENVAVFVSGLFSIGMALSGMGVWSLVVQSLLTAAISMVMMWRLSAWRPVFSMDWKALKDLLGYSSNLLSFNIFNYWVRNLDNMLIGRFIGSSALGVYTRAYSLMLLPIRQISGVLTRVMFPALSAIQNDVEKVKSIYLRSTRILALLTFPIMIGLLVVTNSFVLTVFGDQWAEVTPILQVLCLTGLGQSIGTTVGWIYTSQGRTDLMFRWGVFSGLVYAAAIVIGLRWGVIGIAWAYTLSSYLIVWYPSWVIPGRLINLSFVEMMKNLAGPFYCSAAMGTIVWGLGLILPLGWPEWAYLAAQVPLGIVVYLSLIHSFKVQAYVETFELVREQWQDRFSQKKPAPIV
jgi:PST family polysaccharide transporter